jgi:hypothetical protein
MGDEKCLTVFGPTRAAVPAANESDKSQIMSTWQFFDEEKASRDSCQTLDHCHERNHRNKWIPDLLDSRAWIVREEHHA